MHTSVFCRKVLHPGVSCNTAGSTTALRYTSYLLHYREVERLASLRRIRLRTGAFCNPGATAAALGLSPEDVRSHYEDGGHVCWDDHDLIGALHRQKQ